MAKFLIIFSCFLAIKTDLPILKNFFLHMCRCQFGTFWNYEPPIGTTSTTFRGRLFDLGTSWNFCNLQSAKNLPFSVYWAKKSEYLVHIYKVLHHKFEFAARFLVNFAHFVVNLMFSLNFFCAPTTSQHLTDSTKPWVQHERKRIVIILTVIQKSKSYYLRSCWSFSN